VKNKNCIFFFSNEKIYFHSSIWDNGPVTFSATVCRCRLAARCAIRDLSGVRRFIFSSSSASARR